MCVIVLVQPLFLNCTILKMLKTGIFVVNKCNFYLVSTGLPLPSLALLFGAIGPNCLEWPKVAKKAKQKANEVDKQNMVSN